MVNMGLKLGEGEKLGKTIYFLQNFCIVAINYNKKLLYSGSIDDRNDVDHGVDTREI